LTFILGGSSLVEVGSWHAVIKQPNEYFAALQFRKSSSRLFHKDAHIAQHEPTVFQWPIFPRTGGAAFQMWKLC